MLIWLYIIRVILLWTPLWIFFIPLLILALTCVGFWRRARFRNACAVIGVLIALVSIPFVAVQISLRMDAGKRLEWLFGVAIDPNRVAKYRFELAGLGDTIEFWKLENVDSDECMQIVSKHNLTEVSDDKLFPPGSVGCGPWWWPRSTEGYAVFEGPDREGGSREVWVPRNGGSMYLFRFLE